jgi:hypothetical protein
MIRRMNRNHCRKILLFLGVCTNSLYVTAQAKGVKESGSAVQNNILDSIIAVTIILFILSVINEKITQLIRKYSPFIRPGDKFYKTPASKVWRNIRKRQKDGTRLDDRIEREVNSLSFVIGLLIAVIFCVDLFRMFSGSDPSDILNWTQDKWTFYWAKDAWFYRIPLLMISLCLTGFFLTFGSKFFHDLLDTLFQVKNLKRKLSDSRTFNDPQTIQDLEEFIKTPESKLSHLAVAQRAAEIKQIEGVLSVGPGYLEMGGERVGCLEIHVAERSVFNLLDEEYVIDLSPTLSVKVPSKIIITGGYPNISVGAGGSIANRNKTLGFGTLGGIVKDTVSGERYILSCHHVLNGDLNWKGLSNEKNIVSSEQGEPVIAELSFGFRTNDIDAALARLFQGVKIDNTDISSPKTIRGVETNDAINQTEVTILGGFTKKKVKGFVYNDSWNTKFYYPKSASEKELWALNDLIVLSRNAGEMLSSMSQGGDSGAFVVDNNKNVIGLVVGGDKTFTYAIKMEKIAQAFNIELA